MWLLFLLGKNLKFQYHYLPPGQWTSAPYIVATCVPCFIIYVIFATRCIVFLFFDVYVNFPRFAEFDGNQRKLVENRIWMSEYQDRAGNKEKCWELFGVRRVTSGTNGSRRVPLTLTKDCFSLALCLHLFLLVSASLSASWLCKACWRRENHSCERV